jgi:hypothetical protein
MKTTFAIIAFLFCTRHVLSQANADSLFNIQAPLNIAFTMSIKKVGASKEDTTYFAHTFYYYDAAGNKDSLPVGLKARGNYRLRECYFPPLTIKIQKKDAKNTVFEGNKKLKLVLPCENKADYNDLIVKEYLCYKLYEAFTPYSFKTRLVNIDLTELRKKTTKSFKLKGILVEDVDKTAKRLHAKTVKSNVQTISLDDTSALRFDLFQFMIANTDWSKSFQHNSKIIFQKPNLIPIPYDFDMSGLVDAPYAVVSQINGQDLPINSVRDRYYRGNCRSAGATGFVRKEYLSNKEKLLAVPDILKGQLSDKEINDIKDYLKEYFDILEDEKLFREDIVERCRPIPTSQ